MLNIVLPQTKNAEANVKDLIVSILSNDWPLNIRQINKKLTRIYAVSVSYQATHKAIKKLQRQGVVVEENKKYKLSLQWLKELYEISQNAIENYSKQINLIDATILEENSEISKNYFNNYKKILFKVIKENIGSFHLLSVQLFDPIAYRKIETNLLNLVKNKNALLLVGAAGSGKTTSFWQIVEYYCKTNELIPVYFKLTNLNETDLSKSIANQISRMCNEKFNSNFIETLLEKGAFVLLFDGFNEVQGEIIFENKKINKIDFILNTLKKWLSESKYYNNKFLISSRLYAQPSLGIETWMIKPLNDKAIKKILFKNKKTQKLFSELYNDKNLLNLCRNPLLLKMLLQKYEKTFSLPKNKTKLYHEFVDHLLFKNEITLIGSDALKLLSHLAFEMTPYGTSINISNAIEIFSSKAKELRFPKKYLNDLVQLIFTNHLLQKGDDNQCQFMHHSIQDFFASQELKNKSLKQFISNKSFNDALIFLSGSLQDSSELVSELLKKDVFLAARCLKNSNNCSQEIIEKTINSVIDLDLTSENDFEKWMCTYVLQEIGDIVVDYLIERISLYRKSKVKKIRYRLRWLAGHIKNEKIEDLLIDCLLEEKDRHSFYHTILGLQEQQSKKVVPFLEKLLNNKDPIVRVESAIALENTLSYSSSKIKKIKLDSISDLIKGLKSKNYVISSHSAIALGKLKNKQAIIPVINTLDNQNNNVKWYTSIALIQIATNKDISTLENHLTKLKPENKERLTNIIKVVQKNIYTTKEFLEKWQKL